MTIPGHEVGLGAVRVLLVERLDLTRQSVHLVHLAGTVAVVHVARDGVKVTVVLRPVSRYRKL